MPRLGVFRARAVAPVRRAATGGRTMRLLRLVLTSAAAITMCLAAHLPARAATYSITWLDMSPVVIGTSVPSGSIFNVPGIGNVLVTTSIGASVTDSRAQNPDFIVGSVVNGPDTYQWNNYEYFGTILTTGPDPLVPVQSTVTYTFPGTLPAGTVYVGTIGLGQTTSFGGGASVITVNQNGTFLGDFIGSPPANFGASQFTGGAGTFNVRNSQTGAGGVDPHWNSQLGVVRIDDPVSSVTVIHDGIRGDGIGANIGFDVAAVPVGSTSWGRIKSLYR
jgi:hypothetical protein